MLTVQQWSAARLAGREAAHLDLASSTSRRPPGAHTLCTLQEQPTGTRRVTNVGLAAAWMTHQLLCSYDWHGESIDAMWVPLVHSPAT